MSNRIQTTIQGTLFAFYQKRNVKKHIWDLTKYSEMTPRDSAENTWGGGSMELRPVAKFLREIAGISFHSYKL